MIKILSCRYSCVSARLLRDEMAKLTKSRVLLTFNPAKIRGSFIRYGNPAKVIGPETQFNSAAFIRLVCNKAAFSKLMEEHKIYSPIYHRTGAPTKYPAMIRSTLTSTGGHGIMVCPNKARFDAQWQNGYVWTPFIKTDFELRIHVLGGRAVKVFKKIPTGDKEADLPIRNLDRGYHYQVRDMKDYPKMQALIDTIHPILGGAFYTLDVGWDSVAKKYFIYEANSGSGLNTHTVELYAQYLVKEFDKK